MASFERTKKLNKQYILNNLDKYCFDGRGNIYHIEKMGNLDFSDNYYFYPNQVSDYEEVIDKITHRILNNKSKWVFEADTFEIDCLVVLDILKEKEDWELVWDEDEVRRYQSYSWHDQNKKINPSWVLNRKSGIKLSIRIPSIAVRTLVGELGYRENSWADYLEEKESLYRFFLKMLRKKSNVLILPNTILSSLITPLRIIDNPSPNQNSRHNTYSSQPLQISDENISPEIISRREKINTSREKKTSEINNSEIPTPVSQPQPSQLINSQEKSKESQQKPTNDKKELTNNIPTPLIIIGGTIILLLLIITLKKRKNK